RNGPRRPWWAYHHGGGGTCGFSAPFFNVHDVLTAVGPLADRVSCFSTEARLPKSRVSAVFSCTLSSRPHNIVKIGPVRCERYSRCASARTRGPSSQRHPRRSIPLRVFKESPKTQGGCFSAQHCRFASGADGLLV